MDAVEHLQIAGLLIPYEERKSARAKRIVISINQERVRVSIPRGVNVREARRFVQEKQQWIIDLWQALQAKKQACGRFIRVYADGDKLACGGQNIILHLVDGERKRAAWREDHGRLLVYLPENLNPAEATEIVRKAVAAWYRVEARRVFAARLDAFAARMDLNYRELYVKEQKTKWGSCSAQGNINLNWRLVMAPDQVINYVVVHELAHRKHLNHSSAFWQCVEAYIPDYRQWRKWLRENGSSLVI